MSNDDTAISSPFSVMAPTERRALLATTGSAADMVDQPPKTTSANGGDSHRATHHLRRSASAATARSLATTTGPDDGVLQGISDLMDDDEKLLCGVGSCTPRWLQVFHTSRWLLVVLGACAFVQSFVVNAIFPVGLSTLEKRFHMTSTHTGIISSWYDAAVLVAVFPVCHWGNKGHKGRWIGWGAFVMAFGSFVCALPHYLGGLYEPANMGKNASDFGQCIARGHKSEDCSGHAALEQQTSSYLNPYFLLFILGQTLHGLGSTPLFSIGTAYLDENVSQKASPLYLAIYAVVTSIGPVIGLFVGGYLLGFYIDIDRVEKPPIDDLDPRWLGAWWIGFLASGVAALFAAFPILGFAKELPEAKRHRQKDVNQVHAVSADEPAQAVGDDIKSLPAQVWNILRNPTFLAVIAIGVFESIIINGFAAFMPKILETLLSTTPATASYMSSVVIFAAAAGVLVGGSIIRRLNLQVSGMLKMILVCHVAALLLITGFLIQCPARHFVGINEPFGPFTNTTPALDAKCNAGCDCGLDWNPVCEPESGRIFYSACFAGCTRRNGSAQGDGWTDCKCAAAAASSSMKQSHLVLKMGLGACTQDCGWAKWVFMVLLFFSTVFSFASGIPLQQIMLRVVPFHQRTLAIGVNWTLLRLLGFIPGGVLFGLMIDTACQKWSSSHCPGSKNASCLVYDPARLSWTILAVAVVCKLVAILSTVIGYITYQPNDVDGGVSVATTDSRGPLSLVVNDDRAPDHQPVKLIDRLNRDLQSERQS